MSAPTTRASGHHRRNLHLLPSEPSRTGASIAASGARDTSPTTSPHRADGPALADCPAWRDDNGRRRLDGTPRGRRRKLPHAERAEPGAGRRPRGARPSAPQAATRRPQPSPHQVRHANPCDTSPQRSHTVPPAAARQDRSSRGSAGAGRGQQATSRTLWRFALSAQPIASRDAVVVAGSGDVKLDVHAGLVVAGQAATSS